MINQIREICEIRAQNLLFFLFLISVFRVEYIFLFIFFYFSLHTPTPDARLFYLLSSRFNLRPNAKCPMPACIFCFPRSHAFMFEWDIFLHWTTHYAPRTTHIFKPFSLLRDLILSCLRPLVLLYHQTSVQKVAAREPFPRPRSTLNRHKARHLCKQPEDHFAHPPTHHVFPPVSLTR